MTVDINKCPECGHVTTLIDPGPDFLTCRFVAELLSKIRGRLRLGGLLIILPYIIIRIAFLLTPSPGPEGNPAWVPILWLAMMLAMLIGAGVLVLQYRSLSKFLKSIKK